MASNEDRLRKLVQENIEVDGKPLGQPLDLNVGLTEVGVSSRDLVAFAKLVSHEFNVTFTPDDCANLKSLRQLVEFLDTRAG